MRGLDSGNDRYTKACKPAEVKGMPTLTTCMLGVGKVTKGKLGSLVKLDKQGWVSCMTCHTANAWQGLGWLGIALEATPVTVLSSQMSMQRSLATSTV